MRDCERVLQSEAVLNVARVLEFMKYYGEKPEPIIRIIHIRVKPILTLKSTVVQLWRWGGSRAKTGCRSPRIQGVGFTWKFQHAQF